MSNSVDVFLNSPVTDSNVLFGLLFCLNFEDVNNFYNSDTRISDIEEHVLVLAVSLLETILGVNTPDEYLLEYKNRTLKELAEQIQLLPHLTDVQYKIKLQETINGYQKAGNISFS
jgi:hypothetical protein